MCVSAQSKPAAGKGGKGAAAAEAKEEEFDPLSLVEAKDVIGALPGNWEEQVVNAPKWKDKKEKLDELCDMLKAPKIANNPRISEVVKVLKRLLGDANVVVVSGAIKAIQLLALGTRKEFRSQAAFTLNELLDMLKEKKVTVSQPVNECLDAYFEHCLPLGEMIEAFRTAFAHKIPKVRVDTAAFLVRAMRSEAAKKKPAMVVSAAKPLAEVLFLGMQDKESEVRRAACGACTRSERHPLIRAAPLGGW
jgi:hypothetical protein